MVLEARSLGKQTATEGLSIHHHVFTSLAVTVCFDKSIIQSKKALKLTTFMSTDCIALRQDKQMQGRRLAARDALAIVRATLFRAHTTTAPSSPHLDCLHDPTTTDISLNSLRISPIDVMASFGGAGLGQKVIKPNPYVIASSAALRQTYLLLGSSLASLTQLISASQS